MHIVTLTRLSVAAAALLLLAVGNGRAAGLTYIGQQIVPSGTLFAGTTVGGLSGIDRIGTSSQYLAISDDRSNLQPARFYGLSLDLTQFVRSAAPGNAGVNFQTVTPLLRPDGSTFAANQVDPESIRINPATGTLYWSNEGQRAAAGFQNPTVREMSATGVYVRDFSVPDRYAPAGTVAGTTPGDRGIYNNLAFESLTISTDGRTVYTATENALAQDGSVAGVGAGSNARILSFDVASGQAGAEYVYPVSPVALPPAVPGAFATNGLVELLAVGDRQFVAVERSFATGAATPGVGPNGLPTGNSIRLYFVDARDASDVSGVAGLSG
ncbi:MAG: esterase-like activity of phytase family protein, partial [Chitinophagaceae bacterium]|nr:esterase-like activity of phytase family protein [Rubrivivax sp.]